MSNLKMVRIQAKIDELFKELVDLSDVKNPDEKVNKFYSRSLAALAIVMQCGVEYDIAAQSITDGYHDLELMRFIMIRLKRNLFWFKANGEKTDWAAFHRKRHLHLLKAWRG